MHHHAQCLSKLFLTRAVEVAQQVSAALQGTHGERRQTFAPSKGNLKQ